MLARSPVATTRRTALGGALIGLGAVAGCNLDPPGEDRGPLEGSEGSASEDPDATLVDEVLTELTDLTDLVSAVQAKYPRLRPPMAGLRDLHLGHRAALGNETPPEFAYGGRLAGPAEALTLVRSRERRAQGRLADWSVAAESGTLARLLACMSAGVAQHLVILPASVGGDR